VGHALVGHLLPHADPVDKLTIIPRGMGLGYTLSMPTEDRYLVSKEELIDRVTAMLGGRAAEEIVFHEITSGAADDLEKATKLVRRMVTELGMSEALGPMTYGTKQDQVFLGRDLMRERNYSEKVAAAIDDEVRRVINMAYERAKNILETNRDKLEEIARVLLEKETLEGPEFAELMAGRQIAS
jgi:cell division protease FtsH